MGATIACVAPDRRSAVRAAERVSASLPKARVEAFSLTGYLALADAPDRIVLCPAGRSTDADLRFLALAAGRLLWPGPPGRLRAAIGGIRPHGERPRRAAAPRKEARPPIRTSALLLEGLVGPDRARSALAASGPRDWIVESTRHVRLPGRLHRTLARDGIRWSALEPIELVALLATPALVRARAKWSSLVPPRTRVWIARPRA
ncbi:MAG TPA: hypothetical protein VMT25_04795 [Thermoanaerobaculia bacterium]|nr:hypothetical protein [Thermoanaerobaculia bacterium]